MNTIHCPTTIIQSNQDAVFNAQDAHVLHHHIAGSSLAFIEGCGHMSPMEAPDKVSALLLACLNQE